VTEKLRVLTAADVRAGQALPELAVDVTSTTVVLGALASRDWRPMHHDYHFATERNGVKDIFLNTPNQAAWFERYITDWTGPYGRLGRIRFRMQDSVFPGDRMVFRGRVKQVETDAVGCAWADLDLSLCVGEKTVTSCSARVAVPAAEGDNPWRRKGDRWKP
jgi:acyl dehydratase